MPRKDSKKPLLIALFISLFFIHLPLLYFLRITDWVLEHKAQKIQSEPKAIFLNLKPQALPDRIADIAKPSKQERPNKASAQALYDSKVKEETVARARPLAQPPPQNKQTPPAPSTNGQDLSLNSQLKNLRTLQRQQEKQKFDALFSTSSAAKDAPQLRTSLSGGSPDDFFPDYKIGSRTYLNTLANPHVFYFVELRHKFRMAFNPIPILRPLAGRLHGRGSISVVLGVSLDAAGNLRDMVLIKSSGLGVYDQEAKRTISVSAPFSKPPSNYLDGENRLNMAWTFTVYF